MLENKVMIYDDTCPMCNWYTQKFVDVGVLPENGRMPFSKLENQFSEILDFNKARHEIPLIDKTTNTVIYGLDAFLLLFVRIFPIFKTFLGNKYIKGVLRIFYKFISYNRRVIVGENAKTSTSPNFHFGYRLAYIIFIQFLVLCLHSSIIQIYFNNEKIKFLYCLVFSLCINLPMIVPIIWSLFNSKMTQENIFDFWANWLTTNFLSSVLVLPFHILLFIIFREKMMGLLFFSAFASQFIQFNLISKRIKNNKFTDGVETASFCGLIIQFFLFVLPSLFLLSIFG